MKLITKTMVGTLTTATVAGTVLWGTLTFSGSEDLTFIKDKFDWVKLQYENALTNIDSYKNVLADKVAQIKGYESIQDELSTKLQAAQAELETLKSQGTTDQQTITQMQTRIDELTAQLEALEGKEDAATEEEFNAIKAEVERLQSELQLANQKVAELRAYIEQESNISGTAVISEETIAEQAATRNPYLTFVEGRGDWTSVDTNKKEDLFGILNGLKILDTFKESPVILHMDNYNGDFIYVGTNSKEAFDRVTATNGYTEYGFYTVNGKIASYDEFLQASPNNRLQIQFNYVGDADWTGTLGYTTPDHQ